ncbi:MAG: hypothetical protein G01um101438_263 [Parcubacteria group bacterium Gr01-1014_38]|nr:MAG: hypothetical protein G01um101438_263 [Parcubacteria group bacterium Gr01-1014_38]
MDRSIVVSLLRKFSLPLAVVVLFGLAWNGVRRMPPSLSPVGSGSGLSALEACLSSPGFRERVTCYQPILEGQLQAQGPRGVLSELDRLQEERPVFRAHCHDMAHVLGRFWIARGGTVADGFREGSNICHAGFFHGMVERVFRGGEKLTDEPLHFSPEELRAKVATVCGPEVLQTTSRNIRFQCLHGLGHAVVFSLGYRLPIALEICDVLPGNWDQNSCAGGAFMENITGVERERRMLRAGDPHYPCSIVPPKYRDSCYGMQTSWMLEDGLAWDAIIAACRAAGSSQLSCFQSFGRDVSPRVRQGGPVAFVPLCTQLAPDERAACIRGAVYALADHTWDGRYAYPFCAVVPSADVRAECFQQAHTHLLRSLEQPPETAQRGCLVLSDGKDVCLTTLQQLVTS